MKILFAGCIFGRPEITDKTLAYYHQLKQLNPELIDVFMCGSEGELSRNLVEKYGFYYVESENFPLSKKFDALYQGIERSYIEHDAVIDIGDDIIPEETLQIYTKLINEGVDYFAFADAYFYEIKTRSLHYWPGYTDREDGIGAGRFFSKKALQKVNYLPWNGADINDWLDGLSHQNIINAGFTCKLVKQDGIKVVCLKPEETITSMERLLDNFSMPVVSTDKITDSLIIKLFSNL